MDITKETYLALTTVKGMNAKKLHQCLTNHETSKSLNSHHVEKQKLQSMLNWQASATNHHLLTWLDEAFPKSLLNIDEPPMLLYAKGHLQSLSFSSIAIVGSRIASENGLNNAYRFSSKLSQEGLTIVSGLARGIDGQAHKAAVDIEHPTIAVLGCGINVIYPKQHEQLARQIQQNGLILSEYPLDAQPMPFHFPKRNRIIAGLSLGVLVIEASFKSGSLITARLALEQGKEVFALPGPIQLTNAKGTHALIKQGAKLVDSLADILEELPQQGLKLAKLVHFDSKTLDNTEQNLVKFIGVRCTPPFEIMQNSGLCPREASCKLTELELLGAIKAVPGGYVRT